MSAHHAATSKKRKAAPFYDGGSVIIHGRQSGIDSVRIANPFIHPLDMTAILDADAPGHRKKRPRFKTIRRAQFPAYEEQSRREIAARRAGEYYLTCVST